MANCKIERTVIGQLPRGADLYESLTSIAQKENIRLGRIQAIGATTHAVVAYFDQDQHQYVPIELPGGREILNLLGNISLKDGKPFVHAHIILGDRQGHVFGGHLMLGTKVFACEVFIDEYEGAELIREKDENTGLFIWKSSTLAKEQ